MAKVFLISIGGYMRRLLFCFLIATVGHVSFAQDLTFQNLNESDLKDIVKDFSAVFNHTSVSGASSLGTIFGFEIGVVGGVAKTPRIDALADQSGTDQDASQIPHGEIIGMITVPAGLTVEGGFIPKVGKEDFKFNTATLGLKWTPTDILLALPLSLAVKAHYTKTNVDFHQDIQSVPTDFKYENSIFGLTLLASKSFVIVEPYVGVTYASAKGDLDVSGSTQVIDTTFSASQSVSTKVSSTGFLVGAELKLLIFKAGVEYTRLFDTNRYTGKLSFYF